MPRLDGAGGGVGGDVFALGGLLELVHVVTDVEGAGAEGAEGLRGVGGDVVVATDALEVGDRRHRTSMVLKRL